MGTEVSHALKSVINRPRATPARSVTTATGMLAQDQPLEPSPCHLTWLARAEDLAQHKRVQPVAVIRRTLQRCSLGRLLAQVYGIAAGAGSYHGGNLRVTTKPHTASSIKHELVTSPSVEMDKLIELIAPSEGETSDDIFFW